MHIVYGYIGDEVAYCFRFAGCVIFLFSTAIWVTNRARSEALVFQITNEVDTLGDGLYTGRDRAKVEDCINRVDLPTAQRLYQCEWLRHVLFV